MNTFQWGRGRTRRLGTVALLAALFAPGVDAQLTADAGPGGCSPARTPERALAALLDDAHHLNRLPPRLVALSATAESAVSIIMVAADGTESVFATELIASEVRWHRDSGATQHIIGHRIEQAVPTVSIVTLMRWGWVAPLLYGEHLAFGRVTLAGSSRVTDSSGVTAPDGGRHPSVHPLSASRYSHYAFACGDTTQVLRVGERTIPLLAVRVRPLARGTPVGARLMDGDILLDASRGHLVRLRGRLVEGGAEAATARYRDVHSAGFVDLESAELQGRYWVPVRQRLDLAATFPVIGNERAVIRIVSRLRDIELRECDDCVTAEGPVPGLTRLTTATRDSIDSFDGWRWDATTLVDGSSSRDFDDVAPSRWRPSGHPLLTLEAARAGDVLRFNRVEGLVVGAGLTLRLRDRAPGISFQLGAGWAFAAGRATVRAQVGAPILRARATVVASHLAATTTDFLAASDSGPILNTLLGDGDPYDYVARRHLGGAVVRRWGATGLQLAIEGGRRHDRSAPRLVTRSPLGGPPLPDNPTVAQGAHWWTRMRVSWRDDAGALWSRPGFAGSLSLEQARGAAHAARGEASLLARLEHGPLVVLGRVDLGVTSPATSPQYRLAVRAPRAMVDSAGVALEADRLVLLRQEIWLRPRWLGTTWRVGRIVLPPVSPRPVLGWHAARARDESGAVATRLTALGGVRFFSGSLLLGAARPVRPEGGWRALMVVGPQW